MKTKFCLFGVVFLILFSCKSDVRIQETEDLYQVISLLYDKSIKDVDVPFPPPPPGEYKGLTEQDSIRIDSVIKKVKEERANKRFIVAINPYLFSIKKEYKIDNCAEYNYFLKEKMITTNKDSIKLDISRINNQRNDSIIYFSNDLLENNSRDFYKFDITLGFSNVIFNAKKTKALIISGIGYSRLSGFSTLHFLEKRKNKWEIVCEKGLTIS